MTSVLIVEDDAMLGRAVYRDLTEYGLAVQIAGGFDEALDMLRANAIDVLLTDLRLGTADGIDLLETVRELSPRTRSVLMSGFASARDYQRAVELGVVGVMCKPFTRAELIQCIRQAIDCETGFRGSIHGLSLVDVLQMLNQARRTVAVSVAGPRPGHIYLRDGQIIHAEHKETTGDGALASILAMPAGSLTTSVMPEKIEQTVHREFRELLLDALCHIDESVSDHELDDVFELEVPETGFGAGSGPALTPRLDAPAPPPPRRAEINAGKAATLLELLRSLDGFLGAAVVVTETGAAVAREGHLDLEAACAPVAGMVRHTAALAQALAPGDRPEDIISATTAQLHLVRMLETSLPAFLYLVLDRRAAVPAMAKLALANAVRSIDW